MYWLILAINLLFPNAECPFCAAQYVISDRYGDSEYNGQVVQEARDLVCQFDPSTEACSGK
jgi:hypothetical protein